MSITHTQFLGKKAISLSNGHYKSTIVTGHGCNIVELYDCINKADILNTPTIDNYTEFITNPQHFGNAILFPPNRITNGGYVKNNITYNFYPDMSYPNNHIYSHGMLRYLDFSVISESETDDEIIITTEYKNLAGSELFKGYPHQFTCTMEFKLTNEGLLQTIIFSNESASPMPMGIGFHTAFRIPQNTSYAREDYRLFYGIKDCIDLSENTLPTGKLYASDIDTASAGILPFEPIKYEHVVADKITVDNHTFHGAAIKNTKNNYTTFFETSDNFPIWMLWNNQALSNYVCIEPMSWVINAPNLPFPDSFTHYSEVMPNSSWVGTLNFYAK